MTMLTSRGCSAVPGSGRGVVVRSPVSQAATSAPSRTRATRGLMDRLDGTRTGRSLRAAAGSGPGTLTSPTAERHSARHPAARGTPRRGSPTAEPSAPERAAARPEDLCDDHRRRPRRDDRPDRARGPPRRGDEALRGRRGGRLDRPRDRRRRVLLDAGPVRIRQDDDAADDRRVRAADGGSDRAPRPGRHQRATLRPGREHGLPGLRALPAHVGRRQRRLRPRGQEGPGPASQGSSRAASGSGSPSRARS
jgi:hypothetical protein